MQTDSNKQIANILNISPVTLRDHLREIFAKTHTKNTKELINLIHKLV